MQGTEYVAQLSQFAVVEQAISQSAQLESLSAQIRGVANNEATSLVGKQVTVRGKAVAFDGLTAVTSSGSLTGAAQKVTVRVVDESGKTVRTMELGPRPAGPFNVTWDGRDDTGGTAPKGTYSMRVEATDAVGAPVEATHDVVGTVVKVSFDKGYPELLLDSGATAPISDLVAVQEKPTAPR